VREAFLITLILSVLAGPLWDLLRSTLLRVCLLLYLLLSPFFFLFIRRFEDK